MQKNNLKLDPTYSIIYHDEDNIEFRSGAWNVVSHHFNDPDKNGSLVKVILSLEEHGLSDSWQLSKKINITQSHCDEIINALHTKNLLIPQIQAIKDNIQHLKYKKVILIEKNTQSELLADLLISQIHNLDIHFINKNQLDFITDAGEAIFRDSLLLENIVEQSKTFFSDAFVVTSPLIQDPIFHLAINKIFHEAKIPWLFSSIDGPFIYLGPIFHENFCFECIDERILMNTKNGADYLRYKKAQIQNKIHKKSQLIDMPNLHLLSSLACMEINNYLTTGRSISHHKMLSIFLPTMEFSYHKILRMPGCRVCGIDNAFHGHQIHFDMGVLVNNA